MDTINWLHLRGLALLALLGLFIMYIVLAAFLQDRRLKRRAPRVNEQSHPPSVEPAMTRDSASRVAEPHAWHDARPTLDVTRRAA